MFVMEHSEMLSVVRLFRILTSATNREGHKLAWKQH